MRRSAALIALATLLFVPAALTAQRDNDDWLRDCRESWGTRSTRARHCEIREAALRPPREALTVDPGNNGGIHIQGWDEDSIAITARIAVQAYSAADAEAIARDIKIEASGATIRATGPRDLGRNKHWSVNFIVMVPQKTSLTLATENGPLSVRDVIGNMDLSTSNGPLSLYAVGGDVHARAQNGPLTVKLDGSRWEGAGLDAETMNGPAHLLIPEVYNARIEFGTVNGPMSVGFPITVTLNGRVRDRISTTLGNGGPPIRVMTTNGPMTVDRR